MFQASALSSADLPIYSWSEAEVAQLEAYANTLQPVPEADEKFSASTADDGPKLPWNTPIVREIEGMEAKRARFLAELEDWTTAAKAHRGQDAIDRNALKGLDRLHAHRRAELEGLVRYCRERPRADVTIAIFTLIVLLSDNDEYGACYLSIPRMAEVLSRTTDCIRDGIDRLVGSALIGSEERSGGTTLHWPLAHESFGDKPSLHWLVDHYSPTRRLGRPSRKPLRPEAGGILGNPLRRDFRGFSGPFGKPLPLQPENPSTSG